MNFFIASTLAQAPAGAPPANPASGMAQFFPLIIIFAIFYFLMIRPQQRREKERKEKVSALRAGARVLFCGGMIGTIEEVLPSSFLINIASGAVVEVVRAAVETPLPDPAPADAKDKSPSQAQSK